MLKSIFSSKNKTNNQTFSKKEYIFLKSFCKPFLNIYTNFGHFICTAYQLNLQSMGRPDKWKAARDSQFAGKKKNPTEYTYREAMGASWKLQLLESDKGSFYNQANWIEECEYGKDLCYNNYGDDFDGESDEIDSSLDSEKGSDTDCESDRDSKNNIILERNIIISINMLQSLITWATITWATRCKTCHEPVHLVEDRKKGCWISLFAKTRTFEPKM